MEPYQMIITSLKSWLQSATEKQRIALANRAKTSPQYLYHLAAGYRTLTAEMAAAIEQGLKVLNRNNPDIETLERTELCTTCRNCPHVKK